MSWENPNRSRSFSPRAVAADDSQTQFMALVYRWMVLGLTVTGGVAIYFASTPGLRQVASQNFGKLAIGQLILVMGLSLLAPRLSAATAGALFLAYSALNGVTFSMLFLIYQLGSIAQVFLVTAGTFGAMSLYGTVTKKDLTTWSSFLFMGLTGIVLGSIVNIFLKSGALSFVFTCASVLVFTGLVAFDTQKLRRLATTGETTMASMGIVGALMLYLDFINIFLSLLRLFGRSRD